MLLYDTIMVETFGTGVVEESRIEGAVREEFSGKPAEIIRRLQLLRPIYRKTAAYGHFGRSNLDFTWERTDAARALEFLTVGCFDWNAGIFVMTPDVNLSALERCVPATWRAVSRAPGHREVRLPQSNSFGEENFFNQSTIFTPSKVCATHAPNSGTDESLTGRG